ncbi:Ig-like domain-containing protein [Flexithrix dorotheae]|uniref:Ig-like domain-containing protein n=1 Tax=Flexithrix dorotheae TaxID=70993 RepID=UPI000366AC4C|nr:Ig-like domain-containing protein [Flexithrix dorotheae]
MKSPQVKKYILLYLISFSCVYLDIRPLFAQNDSLVALTGELKKWHKVTLTFQGPETAENATENPFLNYRLDVTFQHENQTYIVPGYYAANGLAGETSADSGDKWRVHFAPNKIGKWTYSVSFKKGENIAVSDSVNWGESVFFDGASGSFEIAATDKIGRDHRGKGRLQYVGEHFLQFQESGEFFLKGGADAPENFLAYEDFDNTPNYNNYRKSWAPHLQHWTEGDTTLLWKEEKGKAIMGALNYLSDQGMNAFSFLTMNINGDDRNVFPYVNYNGKTSPQDDRLRFDCSKLDQWERVFQHADKKGMYLHFKLMERENFNLLDNGELGMERKLYFRELIARFSHHLALNWNLGEENEQHVDKLIEMADYFHQNDPYHHNIVAHSLTTREQLDRVYLNMLGDSSELTGTSMQLYHYDVHKETKNWVSKSDSVGKKWVVANDEQGDQMIGMPHDGYSPEKYTNLPVVITHNDARSNVLWGNLMAGGAGVEYYFGYMLPESDVSCDDWSSRSRMWDYTRYALTFFNQNLPFWEMKNRNDLIGNTSDENGKYCLAKEGDIYVLYLNGTLDSTYLNLSEAEGTFLQRWFNPQTGEYADTTIMVSVSDSVLIGQSPTDSLSDWVTLFTSTKGNDIQLVSNFNEDSTAISLQASVNFVTGKTTSITYHINGDSLATVFSAPFEFTTDSLANGEYKIIAESLDENGFTSYSDTLEIEILKEIPEPVIPKLPEVEIINPISSEKFEILKPVTIEVIASDEDGSIEEIFYLINDTIIGSIPGSDSLELFKFDYDFKYAGKHAIQAKAVDDHGGISFSKKVTVNVVSNTEPTTPTEENKPPVANILFPEHNTEFIQNSKIALEAKATDHDGEIARVEYYINNEKILEAEKENIIHGWLAEEPGTYTFQIKAFDNHGDFTISEEIVFTVKEAEVPEEPVLLPPTLNLSNPVEDTVVSHQSELNVKVEIENADFQMVEFYLGDEKIGEDATYPFENTFALEEIGIFTLFVKGQDENGNWYTSESINVIVEVLGIEDENPANLLEVYPNPGNGIININYPNTSLQFSGLSVFNSSGRLVSTQNLPNNGNFQMDLSQLAQGVYILKFSGNKGPVTRRLIIN